jgi:hypothetical protein
MSKANETSKRVGRGYHVAQHSRPSAFTYATRPYAPEFSALEHDEREARDCD